MTDFFDWLRAGDAGPAAERIAAHFRLSQEEMRRTADALVPAFMLGMQRAMADPAGWSDLVGRVGQATAGGGGLFPGASAGRTVMDGLFNADLMHAIARQASVLTGQAPDVIEKMMPMLGALTFQSMLRTLAAAPGSFPTDAAGQTLAEAMRRSANAVEAFSRPSAQGAPGRPAAPAMASLFAEALKGGVPWMPGGAGASATPGDPFGFFGSMMKAFVPPGAPAASPSASAPKPGVAKPGTAKGEPGTADGAPADPFFGLMDNARSLQADYVREMLSLFERHRPPKP
jgi:hypothetical protein